MHFVYKITKRKECISTIITLILLRFHHVPCADVRQMSRQRLVTAWQNYCESGDELDPTSPMKRTMRMSSVDDEDLLPLPDNALTNNLGLDLVVVVTKVG